MKRFMMITVLVATVAVAWASDYKYLVLQQTDGTEIPFDSIYLIQSEALRMMENE